MILSRTDDVCRMYRRCCVLWQCLPGLLQSPRKFSKRYRKWGFPAQCKKMNQNGSLLGWLKWIVRLSIFCRPFITEDNRLARCDGKENYMWSWWWKRTWVVPFAAIALWNSQNLSIIERFWPNKLAFLVYKRYSIV